MLGIIRVLTTEDDSILLEHGRLMREAMRLESVTRCIPDQPSGIHDAGSEAAAVPKVLALARELVATERVDALSISCAADPGLREAREAVPVPVIGAGESGAHAARMVSESVAVIGIAEDVPPGMRNALRDALHSTRFHPELRTAADLLEPGAREKLLSCAEAAQEEGATAILFACTGFSTIHLKPYFDARLRIPSIDLVQAQAIAYSLLQTGG